MLIKVNILDWYETMADWQGRQFKKIQKPDNQPDGGERCSFITINCTLNSKITPYFVRI